MTKKVYETMRRYETPPNNGILMNYINQQKAELRLRKKERTVLYAMNKNREESRKQKEAERADPVAHDKEYLITKKEEQLLDTNSKLCRQISYQYQFRKRTFKSDQLIEGTVLAKIQGQISAASIKTKNLEKRASDQAFSQMNRKEIESTNKEIDSSREKESELKRHLQKLQIDSINVEEVKLKLEEECSQCEGQLLASQLRKAIERNLKEIHCTFCGRVIKPPNLKIIIGKKVTRNIKKEQNSVEVMAQFISAETLFLRV